MNYKMKLDNFFKTPLLYLEQPKWINYVNEIVEDYLIKTKKISIPNVLNRNKEKYGVEVVKTLKDFGRSYHTESLINEVKLKIFRAFILETSEKFLDLQGFDLKNYDLHFTELWAQDFTRNGGGHHETHIHWNSHVSGFYFLKCSDKTSFPVFEDPRHGAMMTKLPQKDESQSTYANDKIHYNVKPGDMLFFPSYLPHLFPVDPGIDDFRFIHFNLQAVDKKIKI